MKVLIAGGSGLIGQALTRSLLADGHQVWILTRSPSKARLPEGAVAVGWDARTTRGWGELVSGMDAVVNLAGAILADWPWTEAKKRRFMNSRVDASRALTDAVRAASPRPKVFVQGSAMGFYGPHPAEERVTEDFPPAEDFGARICRNNEAASDSLDEMGVRRVILRTSIVLSRQNVILFLMALPAQLFAGGRLGNGRQGFSWIHIDDHIAAVRFLMENENARGAFNLAAPNPVSNEEFLRAIAKVLRRPFWFPVPAFLLKLVLGEMSSMILEGQYVVPKRLQEMGFKFRFEQAESALRDLYKKGK